MGIRDVMNKALAEDVTHMDFRLRTEARLPDSIRNASAETRWHFLEIALEDDSIHDSSLASLVESFATNEDADRTFERVSGWVLAQSRIANSPEQDRVVAALMQLVTMNSIDEHRRYRLLIDVIEPGHLSIDEITDHLERVYRFAAEDSEKARTLINVFFDNQNLKSVRSIYALNRTLDTFIRYTKDKDIVRLVQERYSALSLPKSTYNQLSRAMAITPAIDTSLALAFLKESNWESTYGLLTSLAMPSGHEGVDVGTRRSLEREERIEIAREIANHIFAVPVEDTSATANVAASTFVVETGIATPELYPSIIRTLQAGTAENMAANTSRWSAGGFGGLRREIVNKQHFPLFAPMYALATSDCTDDRNVRSEIISAVAKMTADTVVTADDAVALFDMIDTGKKVTDSGAAIDAVIRSGHLPVSKLETLATRRGRIGTAAKNALASAATGSEDGDAPDVATAPAPAPVEAWDAHFGQHARFEDYFTAASEQGYTPVAALGLYLADTRIDMDRRREARDVLVAMLNHNPNYLDEVPDATWAALNRVRDGLELSAEVLNRMQMKGETAAKVASKSLIGAVL